VIGWTPDARGLPREPLPYSVPLRCSRVTRRTAVEPGGGTGDHDHWRLIGNLLLKAYDTVTCCRPFVSASSRPWADVSACGQQLSEDDLPVLARSPRSADRVTAILDVASQRLNARGVSEEWFGDIAADLGITRPALYSHFDDRDELLFACYMRTVEVLDAAFIEATAADGAVAVFNAFLTATISEEFPELAVVAEIDVLSQAKRDVVASHWAGLVDRIAKVAADGTRLGQLRRADPTVMAQALLGFATWAPLQRRLLPDRPIAAVLAGAREILFRGLGSDRTRKPLSLPDVVPEPAAAVNLFDRASVAAAKREKLLGVASSLFNRRGVGATRIEEIAEAIGLNKRAIFRQFGSKDQLVTACFERANAIYLRIAEEAAGGHDRRVDALHEAIRRVALSMGDSEAPSLSSHVGLGRLAQSTQAKMRERFAALEKSYRDILQEGIDDGSIRNVSVSDVVAALAGALNWVANAELSDAISLDRIAMELADLVISGIEV